MKHKIARLRSQSAIVGALALGVSVFLPVASHATDWLDSIQDARCHPDDIQGVTGNVRNAIEASVRRAEMSIQAPTPVGDLSCLNDLMTLGLDTFSNVGGLLDSLMSGLGDIGSLALDLDIDVSGMICGFAAEKFAELTSPLSAMDKTMAGFASMAANPADRLNGAMNSGFSSIGDGVWNGESVGSTTADNHGGFSGVIRDTDSSGYSGSIEDYVVPDTAASDSDVEEVIYTEIIDDLVGAGDDSWNEYNQRLMQALGQYIGCRVAGELDGTTVTGGGYGYGSWDVPGHISDCTFAPGAWPVTAFGGGTAMEVEGTRSRAPAASIDRSGGQERIESTGSEAADEASKAPGTTIWEMLGR